MKRSGLFAVVILLTLVGVCFAAPRWVPRAYYDSDQQITSASTILYDATVYYTGVTAGDRLTLSNEVAVGAVDQDDIFFTFAAPAAHGTFLYTPERALTVDGGIYLDIDKSGGTLGVNITYQ